MSSIFFFDIRKLNFFNRVSQCVLSLFSCVHYCFPIVCWLCFLWYLILREKKTLKLLKTFSEFLDTFSSVCGLYLFIIFFLRRRVVYCITSLLHYPTSKKVAHLMAFLSHGIGTLVASVLSALLLAIFCKFSGYHGADAMI